MQLKMESDDFLSHFYPLQDTRHLPIFPACSGTPVPCFNISSRRLMFGWDTLGWAVLESVYIAKLVPALAFDHLADKSSTEGMINNET